MIFECYQTEDRTAEEFENETMFLQLQSHLGSCIALDKHFHKDIATIIAEMTSTIEYEKIDWAKVNKHLQDYFYWLILGILVVVTSSFFLWLELQFIFPFLGVRPQFSLDPKPE